MLLVKTKIGPSTIHGIGLFADQFIPKGTTTFRYVSSFDPAYSKEEIGKMPTVAQEFMKWFTYFDQSINKYVLCADNQRYINHSEDPSKRNIKSTPDEDTAMKDIQPGEELLCNYNDFDKEYFERMGLQTKKLT